MTTPPPRPPFHLPIKTLAVATACLAFGIIAFSQAAFEKGVVLLSVGAAALIWSLLLRPRLLGNRPPRHRHY